MRTLKTLGGLFVLLLCTACECEKLEPLFMQQDDPNGLPPFRVLDTSGFHEIGSMSGVYFMTFFLSDPVNEQQVEVFKNVFVTGNVDTTRRITLAFPSPTQLQVLVPTQCPNSFCNQSLTFRLTGGGSTPLQSIDGRLLDGDDDGLAGGDYLITVDF